MGTANIGRIVTWYVATIDGNAAPKSARTGIIVAYIPARVSLSAVAAGLDLAHAGATSQRSA